MSSILSYNALSEDKGLQNVRALITSKWADRGYTQRIVSNIESFYVDSSLDNDADTWQVVLGDPRGDFLALLERNSEVRVELISASPGASGHIFSGISDDVSFTSDGSMTIVGRDYSSLALDSTCPPCRFKSVKAVWPVTKQARELGFTNISLSEVGEIKKTIKTDGSESYWEFWYRLYREEKMWLWCGPNGALIGARLNYGQDPVYYFGTPKQTDTAAIKSQYIPVEHAEIRKSTQGRLGSVAVEYKTGKSTRFVRTGLTDPTLNGWMKKPFKIISDTKSHTEQGARKAGWEEIFEGKVGSLEIRLTISDPGMIIRTNQVAMLRIPEINYGGDFFIIGWRMQADSDGFIQEIRLRERDIALSRRVPEQPKIPPRRTIPKIDNIPGRNTPSPETQDIIAQLTPTHPDWGDFFYKAAQNFQGDWDAGLFLACLLGISWHETKIRNIREDTGHHDKTEWFPYKPEPLGNETPAPSKTWGNPEALAPRGTHDVPMPSRSLETYHETFVNDFEDAKAMIGTNFVIGVGPMALRTKDWKYQADDYMTSKASGQSSTQESDIDVNKITAYLKSKNSPLAPYGAEHVASGKKWGVDPRFIVAISGGETGFGLTGGGPAVHNAWGMLDSHSDSIPYASWPDGIEAAAKHLGGDGLYIDAGHTTVASIGKIWAPYDAANDPNNLNKNWIPTQTKFLQAQGGDPNDVTYKSTSSAKAAVKTSNASNHDQYTAGRWDPESNIWIGAKRYKEALDNMQHSSAPGDGIQPTDGDQKAAMWRAFAWYEGAQTLAKGEILANQLRRIVMIDPGFLKTVDSVIPQIRTAQNNAADNQTSGTTVSELLGAGWPSEEECQAAFKSGYWIGEAGTDADPSPKAPLPAIPYLAAYWQHDRVAGASIKYIVIHDMEQDQTDDAAQICANWFVSNKDKDNPGSAHYCIDNNSIVQSVHDQDFAYGVMGSQGLFTYNDISLHFEHAGWAITEKGHTGTDWSNDYSQKMLRLSAQLTATKAKKYGVPLVYQDSTGLKAGQAGFTGHRDIVAASGTGDHNDPGPNFPWASYMQMVTEAATT